jgi:hypothetical protein
MESSKTLSSGKKDAFDIVALANQSKTESPSNPRDMVDTSSTSKLSKSKPTIKKISMTLKRSDNKTINRDEKVLEMFTTDNSDDDSINENTDPIPHVKYNMPMPKDLDKAIYSNISLTHKY